MRLPVSTGQREKAPRRADGKKCHGDVTWKDPSRRRQLSSPARPLRSTIPTACLLLARNFIRESETSAAPPRGLVRISTTEKTGVPCGALIILC